MPINYEVGKTYPLTFANLIVRGSNQYIVATDGIEDFTIRPYDYQVEYSVFPRIIQGYVRQIGYTGRPYFEQWKEQVLKDRYYQFGIPHRFVVADVLQDNKTNHVFYILSDEYGIQHRYYPGDEEIVKKIGDEITLVVKGIIPSRNDLNNARLDLALPTEGAKPNVAAATPNYPKNAGKKCFGCENEKKEFKSSIVFPAGKTSADIDYQLGIICRTIAGFMNAGGGTLYIGVMDNGYICGIENDYQYLNSGEEDTYTYKQDDDGYLQVITNAICRKLDNTAGRLVSMGITEDDGKKYCVVQIKKASRPIWFEGNKLFVRIVTTNRKLIGDAITQFVLDRVSKNEFSRQKEAETSIKQVDTDSSSDVGQDSNTAPDTAATASTTPIATVTTPPATTAVIPVASPVNPKPKKPVKAWRYITFYDNGEWSFQKEEIKGNDVVCTAVVPSDAKQKNHILILAYKDGHVDAVSLKVLLYGKNGLLPEGKRRGQGLCSQNGNVVTAFCVNKKDMLLLTSEVAGEPFVKALDVDTLGIHDRMGKGNEIIREKGSVLVGAIRIPDDAAARLSLRGSGIFIEKNQKYTKGGVKLNSLAPNYRQLIDDFVAMAC